MPIRTPQTNDMIIFSATPVGSYAKVDQVYKVVYANSDYIRIQNPETGSGTYDTVRSYRQAEWRHFLTK